MSPGRLAIGGMLLVAVGCGKTAQDDGLVARGRSVYMTNCIMCHHTDPARDGNVGPALAGSSLELLQFRVLQIQYPPGYKPKRPTRLMPALPHLENDIPALHAFLNQ
jgi:mono/diheme cytochrome c family protein